jgi:hypothetical protein
MCLGEWEETDHDDVCVEKICYSIMLMDGLIDGIQNTVDDDSSSRWKMA